MPSYVALDCPPYPAVLHIISRDNPKQFTRKTKLEVPAELAEGHIEGLFQTYETDTGAQIFVMFLPEKYNEDVLYHEALHATFAILNYSGISTADEESHCYLQSYIAREVKKRFYKRKVCE